MVRLIAHCSHHCTLLTWVKIPRNTAGRKQPACQIGRPTWQLFASLRYATLPSRARGKEGRQQGRGLRHAARSPSPCREYVLAVRRGRGWRYAVTAPVPPRNHGRALVLFICVCTLYAGLLDPFYMAAATRLHDATIG